MRSGQNGTADAEISDQTLRRISNKPTVNQMHYAAFTWNQADGR